MLPFRSRIVALAVGAVLIAASAKADPLYNVTTLSAPNNIQPIVEGLSDSGQILLWNTAPLGGGPRYSLYNPQAGGTVTSLDSFGSQSGPFDPQHLGPGGQIVGWLGSQGVLVTNGQTTAIPGWGQAVSGNGQVAYQTGPISGVQSSFIDNNGTSTALGTVQGYEQTTVSGVNNSGQAAATGSHDLTGGGTYLSQPLFFNGHTLVPLGTFGGPNGYASAINNNGDVVGAAMNTSGAYVGFVSHNGGPLISLGTLAGGINVMPTSINDSGQIVGNGPGTGGFLYQNGVLTNLSSLLSPSASNLNILDAYAINNAGQIIAEGIAKGQMWAQPQLFLLTPQGEPIPPSPNPLVQSPQFTPEPSTLAFFGLMLAGIAARRWRRRPAEPSPTTRP
jgi:probable HAF family extracellular repeat protein